MSSLLILAPYKVEMIHVFFNYYYLDKQSVCACGRKPYKLLLAVNMTSQFLF